MNINYRIVGGLRFIEKNKIIFLQIQKIKASPNGFANTNDIAWQDIPNYKRTDKGVKRGVDFHTLNRTDRSIDLDDIVAPPGYIITGVKFVKVKSHLKLFARITEYDFTTAALNTTNTKWISTSTTDTNRKEIDLTQCGVTVKPNVQTKQLQEANRFVTFTHSSLEADAAQTTLPFIDIQPVSTQSVTPLIGVGLYYKSEKHQACFIAPKIFTYNFTNHLNDVLNFP